MRQRSFFSRLLHGARDCLCRRSRVRCGLSRTRTVQEYGFAKGSGEDARGRPARIGLSRSSSTSAGTSTRTTTAGPELDRRGLDECGLEFNAAQIIVEMMALTAVERIATHPDAGAALLPRAGSAKVVSWRVSQEHIPAAAIPCLHSTAIQLPRSFSQGARSMSSVTVTRRSISLGEGSSVASEPIKAMRFTPERRTTDSAK